jgi:hypothetical protein
VLAQIAQLEALEEIADRLGAEDLAATPAGGDPSGAVDVDADITVVNHKRLARVETHADANRDTTKCGLGLKRRRSGVACPSKHVEERVALRVHLGSAVAGARGAQETPVLHKRLRVTLRPEIAKQPRRPFDVSEKEGDGAGRQSAHVERLDRYSSACHAISKRLRRSARLRRFTEPVGCQNS